MIEAFWLPFLKWYLLISLAGWLAFPLAHRLLRFLPEQDARLGALAIVGALMEGLLSPQAPDYADAAAAREAVQTVTLFSLRALGVIDARARGMVAQVVLP